MSPHNLYVEALPLIVVEFGDGAFGRWLGLDDMRVELS